MERSDYLAQIKSLSDTVSQFKDMISYPKSAHESDVAEKSRLQAQLFKFEELIVTLTNEVSSLRKELVKQNDRNNRHNKQTFGKSSLKFCTRDESKPSREEEKQQYSTPDSLAGEKADKASVFELDESKVTSEPLDKKRGPRGSYDLMDAAQFELVDRYQLHLPVYRELLRLTGERMSICGQTVSNWLRKGHELLQMLLPSLKSLLLKTKSILHIDETKPGVVCVL